MFYDRASEAMRLVTRRVTTTVPPMEGFGLFALMTVWLFGG